MKNAVKIFLILIIMSFIAVYVFKIPWSVLLPYGVILLCPLMHFAMMKNMDHNKDGDNKKAVTD